MAALKRLQREVFQQLLTITRRLESLEVARAAEMAPAPAFTSLQELRNRNPRPPGGEPLGRATRELRLVSGYSLAGVGFSRRVYCSYVGLISSISEAWMIS